MDTNMNVGLLVIATNKYTRFLQPLIKSADKFFLSNTDINVEYFVFTDSEPVVNTDRKLHQIHIDHKPWPYPTLYRYKYFTENSTAFDNVDYLYYCDSDMLFVDHVGEEILGDLVGTIHPGFNGARGTPETNPRSLAYVAPHEKMQYCAGGFNGGKKSNFLQMSKTISSNIDKDLQNNIIAIWHDESHMNRYYIDNHPTNILDTSYCHPGYSPIQEKTKLIALVKNHKDFRHE
jgi:histo-blood group ABO system transferase